jgi:hypothetical protein
MGERGTDSQVSVVRRSHGWLEVEEGSETSLPVRRRKESKKKSPPLPWAPALPFIRQGRQVT